MLDDKINYIVSGLERSGTSLMMRLLQMGGLPTAFDESRPADDNNPHGYFELEGGKIINSLMDGTFDIQSRRGQIVKVTAYGLRYLPQANYRIVYMMRNIDEVLKSMRKMGADIDEEKDRALFNKLNRVSLELMRGRDDMEYVTANYRDLMNEPVKEIEKLSSFFGAPFDVDAAVKAVDPSLYRNVILDGK